MLAVPLGWLIAHALNWLVLVLTNGRLPVPYTLADLGLALIGTLVLAVIVVAVPLRRATRLRPGDDCHKHGLASLRRGDSAKARHLLLHRALPCLVLLSTTGVAATDCPIAGAPLGVRAGAHGQVTARSCIGMTSGGGNNPSASVTILLDLTPS